MEEELRAKAMGPWVACLLPKYEHLSLDLQHPREELGMGVCAWTPSNEQVRWRQEALGLAGQPV